MNHESSPSFSAGRKWSLSLNVLVTLLTMLALLGMFNYLAARHFLRLHWEGNPASRLSPLSLKVLASLTNDVKIIAYFDKEEPIFPLVSALLKEYKFASPRISVEIADNVRDPGAVVIKTKYQLETLKDKDPKDVVIFDCNHRWKFVDRRDLYQLDTDSFMAGRRRDIKPTHFRGEVEFTTAIFNVASPRQYHAYFLQGHGEHGPDVQDPVAGYSKFAAVLRENIVEVGRLSLFGTNEIPANCNLLVVPGAVRPLTAPELTKIEKYLNLGGRLLVLFNYFSVTKPTGLEKLLENFGVQVGDDIVVDLQHSVGKNGDDLLTTEVGSHPIVKSLLDQPLQMVRPRSISLAARSAAQTESARVDPLVATSADGTVITDIRNGVPYPSPTDVRTNVPLAVAVEKGAIPGVSAERGAARLVVIGDSYLFGNQLIDGGANREFAYHTINWLLDRPYLLAVPPKPIREFKLALSHGELSAVRWLLLAGLPGAVLLVGLLVWARRRK